MYSRLTPNQSSPQVAPYYVLNSATDLALIASHVGAMPAVLDTNGRPLGIERAGQTFWVIDFFSLRREAQLALLQYQREMLSAYETQESTIYVEPADPPLIMAVLPTKGELSWAISDQCVELIAVAQDPNGSESGTTVGHRVSQQLSALQPQHSPHSPQPQVGGAPRSQVHRQGDQSISFGIGQSPSSY